jgi:hypothetical protein
VAVPVDTPVGKPHHFGLGPPLRQRKGSVNP